ncbi:hypothetical protein C9374_007288 [Naegleria lovaniensis]|uniref:Lariat debranching enzyme C-terminal domain-containing protein n=1 Tax=Naegleria lovaniensis TaxID=51637 RepID=A0AA88KS24_NAELO|nr:uncharacterized protein C9374_007288 [Naegleria lovaniensis]KAG2393757.1 hypothetical protein C9374_007288 [Naegleria lovaniensis]
MYLAVEGCCHGDLDKIYATLLHAMEQKQMSDQKEIALKSLQSSSEEGAVDDEFLNSLQEYRKPTIDVLLICGDFESIRHADDLNSMSVPDKYKEWKDFYKYFAKSPLKKEGEETKIAPIPTLFIGGNHEASLYLMSLPFGGFVTDKIYYMGNTGFINFKKRNPHDGKFVNLLIGGWSGIYKDGDFFKDSARFFLPKTETGLVQESDRHLGTTLFDEQHVPFSEGAKRSVYHVRFFEFWKMLNMKVCLNRRKEKTRSDQPLDVFMSHDWPTGVTRHGDLTNIRRFKDHVMKEIEDSDHKLGNPWGEKLLNELQPKFWFSAHMHCKFSSVVSHHEQLTPSNTISKTTKFLALDKCLPKRDFLQMVNLDHYIDSVTEEEIGLVQGTETSINDNTEEREGSAVTSSSSDVNDEQDGHYYFDLDWLAITKLFHAYRYEISSLLKQPHIQKIQKQAYDTLNLDEIAQHVSSTSLPFSAKNRMYPQFTLQEIEKEKDWILERSKTFANGKFANLRIPMPSEYALGTLSSSNTRSTLQMDPQTLELLAFLGFDE